MQKTFKMLPCHFPKVSLFPSRGGNGEYVGDIALGLTLDEGPTT